jgi:uncharacterized protein (DUF1501 family)
MHLGDDNSDDVGAQIASAIASLTNSAATAYNTVENAQLNRDLVARGLSPLATTATGTVAIGSSGNLWLYGLLAVGAYYVLRK